MKQNFSGWIKPETITEISTTHKTRYFLSFKRWARLRVIIKFIENSLWKVGVAVHDPVFGECTKDFNCCCDCGRKAVIKFRDKR